MVKKTKKNPKHYKPPSPSSLQNTKLVPSKATNNQYNSFPKSNKINNTKINTKRGKTTLQKHELLGTKINNQSIPNPLVKELRLISKLAISTIISAEMHSKYTSHNVNMTQNQQCQFHKYSCFLVKVPLVLVLACITIMYYVIIKIKIQYKKKHSKQINY